MAPLQNIYLFTLGQLQLLFYQTPSALAVSFLHTCRFNKLSPVDFFFYSSPTAMMEYQNKSAVGMGCNSSLRPACSRCYGGLGKLTVDGGKDNSADAVTYAEAEVGAGLQSAQLLLLPRRKRSFPSFGSVNWWLEDPGRNINIRRAVCVFRGLG